MANTTYSEKLKSPFWQKKRLMIFNRDGWACVQCGSTTVTLQVHHKKYVYGREPWEYDNKELETLCENCHRGEHNIAPVHVSVAVEQFQYEGLYKVQDPVLVTLDGYISDLQNTLKDPISDELMEDVMKNIMFLQAKRKELVNG
jgi:hypothetical protein